MAVRHGEDVFEFSADVAGIGWAVTIGADSDLQVAALNKRRHVEVTQFRLIDDVAEHFELLAVGVDLSVQGHVVGSDDGENSLGEVILRIGAYDKLDVSAAAKLLEILIRPRSDDDDPCPGGAKGLNFPRGNVAGANDDDTLASKIEIYRVFGHEVNIPRKPGRATNKCHVDAE